MKAMVKTRRQRCLRKMISLAAAALVLMVTSTNVSAANTKDTVKGNSKGAATTIQSDLDDSKIIETASEDGGELFGNPSIDEQVIYEGDNFKVYATKLEVDSLTGHVTLSIKLENNTNESLMVLGDTVFVNDEKIDSALYVEANPGESIENSGYIMNDSLKDKGIDKFESLVVYLDGYTGDYVEVFSSEKAVIQLKSEDASEDGEEDVIVESKKYSFFGYYMNDMYIKVDDPEVNGWYVELRNDGTGYIYFGDDTQGEVTSWSGTGDDFNMQEGAATFGEGSSLKDGVLSLDCDGYVVVFLSDEADADSLNAVTLEEYSALIQN